METFTGDEEEEETTAETPASDDIEEGMHAVEDEGETVDFSDDADADGDEDEDES